MLFNRNFTYWIDKRKWKYYFLMVSLELDKYKSQVAGHS
jgi:hypothetical protein